jgi:hypothetical protein
MGEEEREDIESELEEVEGFIEVAENSQGNKLH